MKVITSGVYIERDFDKLPERVDFRNGDLLNLKSGRYAISKVIGQGGFGTVYLITNDLGRPYAFKILDLWKMKPNEFDQIISRFEQGFKAGTFDSEYLIKNHYQGKLSGNPYIIMEFCPNGSLGTRQKEFQNIASFEPVAIAILQALNDLHNNGIIHRDIKPDNVLFDKDNTPKLTDFDIAGNVNRRLTVANWLGRVKEIWGTAVYAPPEQLNPKEAFTFTRPSMDMFAFGVTCYETLTGGRYPYGSFEDFEVNPVIFYEKVRTGKFTPITQYRPDLPEKWVSIIHECLIADPNKRIQKPSDLLRRFNNSNPVFTAEPPVQYNEWVLRVMMGEEVGKEYNLERLARNLKRNMLRMGWGDKHSHVNDISILELHTNYISSCHATLELAGRQWVVRDGQWSKDNQWKRSLNGTMVNNRIIDSSEGVCLNHNDIVTIGDVTLKVVHT